MSIAYMNQREFLAADAIAPILPVKKKSDLYATWSRADWMRRQMKQVADNAPSPIMSHAVSTTAYMCLDYRGKTFVSDAMRENAMGEFELDQANVNFVTHQALLEREAVVAANFWTTGVWGTDATPSTLWSAGSSDPYGDMRTGCRTIFNATGKWPTDLVLGTDCWDTLAEHADTLARITGGSTTQNPAEVKPEQIAQILGLKRVTIAGAINNTASAGATISMAAVYDVNDALLVYRPDSPGQFEPSGGYTMSWTPFDNVKDGAAAIKTWRSEDPDGEWFRGQMYMAPVVTSSVSGYFFNEATS
jgi:hypothetical protein